VDDEAFPVPSELAAAVARSHDPARRAWLFDLPQQVAGLVGRWGAQLDHPFEHDGDTTAMLVERCRPGEALRSRSLLEQHQVICDLLRGLHRAALPSGRRFRPLAQMCDEWAVSAAQGHARRPRVLDAGLVREGLALWRELPRNAAEEVLLCTDLHAGKVLSGQRAPWLPAQLPGRLAGRPRRARPAGHRCCRARRGAGDQWLFARCVQESWARPVLAPVAQRLATSPPVR
jgi:streptomycin 6-kinase